MGRLISLDYAFGPEDSEGSEMTSEPIVSPIVISRLIEESVTSLTRKAYRQVIGFQPHSLSTIEPVVMRCYRGIRSSVAVFWVLYRAWLVPSCFQNLGDADPRLSLLEHSCVSSVAQT